jgi:hypothetical protein
VLAHTVDVSVLARNAAQARGKEYFDLVKSLAWPVILALALYFFRKPVARLLEGLGKQRITALSVLDVKLEFAASMESKQAWSDLPIDDSLFGGYVDGTTVNDLFDRINDDTAWTYMIVDIEHGKKWLLSRLFLFTAILQQMGFLKCVVFVESRNGCSRRFLGTATPEHVYAGLSKKYERFALALKRSYLDHYVQQNAALETPSPNGKSESTPTLKPALKSAVALNEGLPKGAAGKIVNGFMKNEEIQKPHTDNPLEGEWVKIKQTKDETTWEHTKWLDTDSFRKDLLEALVDHSPSYMEDDPDVSKEKRIRRLLRRDVRYVALVNKQREFLRLFDREPLVKQFLVKQVETEGDGD